MSTCSDTMLVRCNDSNDMNVDGELTGAAPSVVRVGARARGQEGKEEELMWA